MTDIVELVKSMDALHEEQKRLVAKVREEGKAVFNRVLQAFFEKYSDAAGIAWTQYTPYFNDGDACVFSIHDVGILVGEDPAEADEWGSYPSSYDSWHYKNERVDSDIRRKFAALEQDFNAVEKFIHGNEDLMLHLFGDHARVECSSRGIDVAEHEHD